MEYPMYIGGQPVKTDQPKAVELPYDGSVVGTVYQATKEQVDAAIAAASAAAPVMREMTLDERSTILRCEVRILRTV
jgi:acyl-CoA reductase-like NAD-dependent aldehyde dehydrogenase